jgi:hypothetical protein
VINTYISLLLIDSPVCWSFDVMSGARSLITGSCPVQNMIIRLLPIDFRVAPRARFPTTNSPIHFLHVRINRRVKLRAVSLCTLIQACVLTSILLLYIVSLSRRIETSPRGPHAESCPAISYIVSI